MAETLPALTLAVARAADIPSNAIDCLPPAERDLADRRRADRGRQQFVAGRFLLRSLLEQLTGMRAAAHTLAVADSGKPYCPGGPAVSIAHSGDVIVCAVASSGEIGVDIECIDAQRDHRLLARSYFTAAENAWLATREADAFYRLWVLKEAWLKAIGAGIGGGLRRLECLIEPPVIEARVREDDDCHLSLLTGSGVAIGVAGNRADHRNPILLEWRKQERGFRPAQGLLRLASGSSWRACAANVAV